MAHLGTVKMLQSSTLRKVFGRKLNLLNIWGLKRNSKYHNIYFLSNLTVTILHKCPGGV